MKTSAKRKDRRGHVCLASSITGNRDLLNSLKKNAVQLNADITPEELKDLLARASSNGNDINFDEFYEIMTKRTFA